MHHSPSAVPQPAPSADAAVEEADIFAAIAKLHMSGTSKADLVKVTVQLKEGATYVLSRYLISRYLLGLQVPAEHATKIALRVKKMLVARGRQEVTQSEVEHTLFAIMRDEYGYGEDYCTKFKQLTQFYTQRVPLVVCVWGPPRCGSTTICRMLSESLQSPLILHSDVVLHVLSNIVPLPSGCRVQAWLDPAVSDADLCAVWDQLGQLVAKGVSTEVAKCVREGKVIVIEGSHLGPAVLRTMFPDASQLPMMCNFFLRPDPKGHEALARTNHHTEDVDVEFVLRRIDILFQHQCKELERKTLLGCRSPPSAGTEADASGERRADSVVRVVDVDVTEFQDAAAEMHYHILERILSLQQQHE